MSTGFCCCFYFGEYDDKATNNANLNNPLLRVDPGDTISETDTEMPYEEYQERRLGEQSDLPSWVTFETVNNCWECDLPFEQLGLTSVLEDVADSLSSKMNNFLSPSQQQPPSSSVDKKTSGKRARNKRHHCRRCRNVFCGDCANRRSRIVLLEMEMAGDGPVKEQRVCLRCHSALQAENLHLMNRNFLLTAQPFKKHEAFGLTTRFVQLQCSADFGTLVMTSGLGSSTQSHTDKESARHIPMGCIMRVELKGLTTFEVHWDGGEKVGLKRLSLEADTNQTASRWVQYLSESARRAREPSLKISIELERKQKVEKENRAMKQFARAEAHESRRKERAESRQALRERYSHNA